jgi:hypothetical protein
MPFIVVILDTRPGTTGPRSHGITVPERNKVAGAIELDDFFDDLPVRDYRKKMDMALRVQKGHLEEYPKGVFIGLIQDPRDCESEIALAKKKTKAAKTAKKPKTPSPKKPKAKSVSKKGKSAKTSKTSAGVSTTPRVVEKNKGVFIVDSPTDSQLKKIKELVKSGEGSVRKLPGKDSYTVKYSGSIKDLKSIV